MSNNIITTNKNAKQALVKFKSLIDITNKLLAKRSQQQIVENPNNLRLSISLGHEESVNNMIFTSDGNYILSASVDGTMKLWDIHSGKEVRTFEGNKRRITSLAITSDGKYVVTGGFNLEIILWNLYTGEKVREYHDEESIPCMDYATDIQIINNKIISKHGGTVKYWDINSGEIISGFGYIDAISPDRKTAITFYDEYGIMWDIQSGEKIKTLDKGGFKSRFTPDGKYIVSEKGEVITLWDAQKGEIIRIFEESGKYAVLSDGEIILLDTEYEDDFYERGLIYALQVTPDSNYVITGNSNGILVFWDIQSGKQTKALYHDGKWVNSIAVDSSGKYMVSGGGDGTIVLWDLGSYKAIRTFGMHSDSLHIGYGCNKIEISEQGDHIILQFENGREWIAWTQDGDYNCSEGAEKYICFVDDSKGMPVVVDTSHPIYKQKKKKILPNDYLSNHDKYSRRR